MLLASGTALAVLSIGQIRLSAQTEPDLYLQKTRLGWVIGGSDVPTATRPKQSRASCLVATLQTELTRFWEVEEGPSEPHWTEDETECEKHFRDNVTRNSDGRYCVALPFNGKQTLLGDSKTTALRRFNALERKLNRDEQLCRQYHGVIDEYLTLQHMTKVPADAQTSVEYYLPHLGVIKESSLTTKLRVVFDASAPTTTGISLNNTLHIGPAMQNNLLHLLLRFRLHQYVLTGDIEKMFLQFLIRPDDRKYQRILWRDNTGEICPYELNTVTFGVASAPYLASRCLMQLAEDEAAAYPTAAEIVRRDFYVDDVLTGAPTKEEATALLEDLIGLLQRGGLPIRQWASNEVELLRGLPEGSVNKRLELGETSSLKTLGVIWNSNDDRITYTVKTSTSNTRVTKRHILSEIAKIYDPLGLLGPVIITAKIMIQKLWCAKVGWDESLPASLHTEWERYYRQLALLNNVSFPRYVAIDSTRDIQLHCFCDASERAYGTCVYARTTDHRGNVHVQLFTAKSRVAPLKQLTVPRLELCGALLSTSLSATVQQALHVKISQIFYWTDSTIVLNWISTAPQALKTFVANRAAQIQAKTDINSWFHVRGADNPADCLSRGQTPEEYLQPSIWPYGPSWLNEDEANWPSQPPISQSHNDEERRTICLVTTMTNSKLDSAFFERFSAFGRLLRVTAYCLRWRPTNQYKGPIAAAELISTHAVIMRAIQRHVFKGEIQAINEGKSIPLKSPLIRLNPFMDQDGILRVGGRLKHSTMPFAQKHPVILPRDSHVTRLIIENEHRTHLHAGVQGTLYALRRRYWPLDGRSQVWKYLKRCVKRCRAKPPNVDYVMGNLPEARVTEARPFARVGIDYCGPFLLKEKRHRNRTTVKAYVAVFVCLAVKAIHLELVTDLTSEGFIAALRRFISRRGLCSEIYSDNGSNFIGANRELREIRHILQTDNEREKIQGFLSEKQITWHFIPPLTPHFGGLWEAAVKAFKYHLKRVVGTQLFTYECFNSLIIEIEAVLNSRPLTPISSDPNDFLVLTPGHFLIGDSVTSLPERDYRDTPSNRLSIWQHVQKLRQDFWARWHREYLNELTKRSKWTTGQHPIQEGTVVLLRDNRVPPLHWLLGRVTKIHPGTDGVIRVVTIKTAASEFDRSVKNLVPLPIRPYDPMDETSSPTITRTN